MPDFKNDNSSKNKSFNLLTQNYAKKGRNLYNETEITSFLKNYINDLVSSDPQRLQQAKKWIATCARKHWIQYLPAETIDKQEAQLPWAKEALARGDILFTAAIDPAMASSLSHIVDWFLSQDGPRTTLDWTRISYQQALFASEQWLFDLQKQTKQSEKQQHTIKKLINESNKVLTFND